MPGKKSFFAGDGAPPAPKAQSPDADSRPPHSDRLPARHLHPNRANDPSCPAHAPDEVEVDPFAPPLPDGHPHRFGRVPVLSHGAFKLYETAAITRYADPGFPGPPLVPSDAKAAARMAPAIAIAIVDAFRTLVLQVYAHRVFRPAKGLAPDGHRSPKA